MLEELIRRYFPKKWQRNRQVSVIFAVVMKKISRNIIVLCVALTTALSAYSQDSIAANPDDEPIDIELARMPVRRPDHAVPTIVTLRGEAAIARFAELAVVPEKQEESKRVIAQGNAAVSSALQAQRTQRKQTQEEIDANVEKYIAAARAKAPKHETYRPCGNVTRRIYDEERMTQDQLLASFDAKHRLGATVYKPKSAPSMVEKNAIYLYFEVPTGGRPGPMRIKVQYYADDRLDTQAVEFQINGEKYRITPNHLDTRKNGKYVSEWFDMILEGEHDALVEAMGMANYVRVKFIGKSCNHIKDMTRDQVADLRKAYFLKKNFK